MRIIAKSGHTGHHQLRQKHFGPTHIPRSQLHIQRVNEYFLAGCGFFSMYKHLHKISHLTSYLGRYKFRSPEMKIYFQQFNLASTLLPNRPGSNPICGIFNSWQLVMNSKQLTKVKWNVFLCKTQWKTRFGKPLISLSTLDSQLSTRDTIHSFI